MTKARESSSNKTTLVLRFFVIDLNIEKSRSCLASLLLNYAMNQIPPQVSEIGSAVAERSKAQQIKIK